MDWYLIILRAVHIFAAVFWVGSAFLFFFFIQPSVKELGSTGQQFMGHLATEKKMPVAITAAGAITVALGILLYWRVSGGLDLDWITSSRGVGFTIGAVAATLAFLLGLMLVKPAVDRMSALGAEIGTAGAPSEAQAAEMQRLSARLTAAGRVNIALLSLAVVTMATARYW